MLICDNCGSIICEEDADKGCPHCGWDELSEASYCEICGEWMEPFKMASEHCCDPCADEQITIEDGLHYIDTDPQMQKEFYIEFEFDSTVDTCSKSLIDLCKESFKTVSANFPQRAREDIKVYLHENWEFWGEWAVKNTKRGVQHD